MSSGTRNGGNRGGNRGGGRGRGRIPPSESDFITRGDLMAEMGLLRDSIREMLRQNGSGGSGIPDSIPEEEIITTPIVPTAPRKCDYKMFLSCKPPTYTGERDPVKAMRWIKEIESVFKTSKCGEEDKVLFGTAMLKADALYWWESFTESSGADVHTTIIWSEFSTAFKEQFCPQAAVKELEEEFMNLQQGGQTVRDYAAKFLEKSRFAEYYVVTEKMKTERFVYGLNAEIRRQVAAREPANYSAAVNAAETVERDNKREGGDRSMGKRKWEGPQYDPKKSRFQRPDNRQAFRQTERSCPKCHRVHQGNC